MGQGASTAGISDKLEQPEQSSASHDNKGSSAWKTFSRRSSRSSAGSRSSCNSTTGQQERSDSKVSNPLSSSGSTLSSVGGSQDLAAAGYAGQSSPPAASPLAAAPQQPKQQQQQQAGHSLPPRAPLNHTQSFGTGSECSSGSNSLRQGRRSSSLEQGNTDGVSSAAAASAAAQRAKPKAGQGSAHNSAAAAGPLQSSTKQQTVLRAGSITGSVASAGSTDGTGTNSRASFSRDAEPEKPAPAAAGNVLQDGHALHQQNLLMHNQQQHRASRASGESVVSKASSAGRSGRSSFAAEADPEQVTELDHYGRPSFAAFEPAAKSGRGAVFEASLPPDLADMYRRLAVLLPQAPIPLVTILQLWGITDPTEAQETVQIFVLQGVLKVATLPDGATWLMVSPEHQQFILADHPERVKEWHQGVLNIYIRQVIAARFMQQQGLGRQMLPLQIEEVQPSQFINDGYIWLAVTHHLLGAGQLSQVRALLTDPAWLEVKLHCYGVAAVVDDFRSYLQVETDLSVKAVLQAFQMSLSCCMERSHMPMMQHQLVLRLMAAAQAAPAVAKAQSAAEMASAAGAETAAGGSRTSIHRTGSGSSSTSGWRGPSNESGVAHHQQQQQYKQFQSEMQMWFAQQYSKCRAEASVLSAVSQPGFDQQQLPPHLMGYTPSLRQAGGMHRMALRGHLGPIRKVVITPDGKDVLTASDDGTVQVWDMDIGDCVMQLCLPEQPESVHSGQLPGMTPAAAPITTLAVTGDGGCCLCGDAQGWLSCWNLKAGQLVQRVRAHRGRLNAIVLDNSGSRCMTAGEDTTAKLWSLPVATPGGFSLNGGLIGALQLELEMTGHGLEHAGTGEVLDVAFSSDGMLGATVSNDMKAKVWELEQQICVQTLRGHTGWVVSVQFIGSTHNLVTASHDGAARVWDAWTGDCLSTLIGHTGRLNSVVCSGDGRTIVTCSDDQTARVWETCDYTCIGVLQGHTGWINDVALPRNGAQAVTISGDSTARVWDTKTGKCLQVLQGHSDDVTCVVLTSRARFVVTGSVDGTAQVWDLAAGDVHSLDIHDGKVISVVACPDGSHAASIGADGCLRLWDLATGACLSNKVGHSFAPPQTLIMVDDGSLAFSSAGNRKLVAWDLKEGTPSIRLPPQQGSRTKCTHFSADGSTAIVLLFDSSMAVYDTRSGEVKCQLMQRGDRDAQRVHSGGVNAVYLTSDGSKALSVSKDATARVWDTTTGVCTLVLQGHEDSVHAAVISSDESLLATASFDCTVRLWDLVTGHCLKVLQHTDPVMRVAFSPSGCGPSRLVTTCEGRALWLWDVDSGACVAALGEHKEAVTSVAFSPDGLWLASTSQDRSVLVWEAGTGRLAGLYVGDAAMLCCAFGVRGAGGATDQQQWPRLHDQKQQSEGEAATGSTAAAVGGTSAPGGSTASADKGSAVAVSGSTAAAGGSTVAAEVGIKPQPGGLTLVVGDASGHVHLIDCVCDCIQFS